MMSNMQNVFVENNAPRQYSYFRLFCGLACVLPLLSGITAAASGADNLEKEFMVPPDSARPWVYWYFMDGNLSREGMRSDLEAMKQAGIGGAIYLEVGIGIKRGPVKFMSQPWQDLVGHAISEAGQLGMQMALASGPGWCGTGGPWITPELSMQHLVASETTAIGPAKFDSVLPRPQPRVPFFGEATLSTPQLHEAWRDFYRDEVVLAFPTPSGKARIADLDEKALYYRAPYSSQPGVKPFLPAPSDYTEVPMEQCVAASKIIDLTGNLAPDGRLKWDVPTGKWTILRFGRTITGQTTRPAPAPGLGLESDKFDKAAIDAHLYAFVDPLLENVSEPIGPGRGLTTLHFDSWEMGSQNWSGRFREEFTRRRGYDPVRFLPTMTGRFVDNAETSGRFLWDLRQTAQELVVENHIQRMKEQVRKHGLVLSIEPYDMNPCADLKLGGAADVPMGEFWSKGWSFPTEFSCIEAASIGHTLGRPVIGAEAFTALGGEDWQQYPGSMKAQGDWAFCCGINRFVFHRFQAQPWLDRFPGMTMGPYGVHWDRTQTWWDMVWAYHLYISRCQQMLRRGLFVADILYLNPEGAPCVFRPPSSATRGDPPDRRGYSFDGCDPDALIDRASVQGGRIVFPDGMSYRILVLPLFDTMTPRLLQKIANLVEDGATVMGIPPRKSPSLAGYPQCDQQVRQLAEMLWGAGAPAFKHNVGKGCVINCDTRKAKVDSPAQGRDVASRADAQLIFQCSINVSAVQAAQKAQATMSAGDDFSLLVNGRPAGIGKDIHDAATMDLTSLLKAGTNVLSITTCGLIGSMSIRFGSGIIADDSIDAGKDDLHPADGSPSSLMDLGLVGFQPWVLVGTPTRERDIYPDYQVTARALSGMGVCPDFESDGDVRYIHRRDREADIYFIANKEGQTRSMRCRFRVTGRMPEWWNPVTGECRDLPESKEEDGLTVVPMRLEVLESGFVVFRKPRMTAVPSRQNFPALRTVMTLTAPWEVSFDPKWGGPQKILFPRLDDWSKRPEPGIRYYSGKAVYRTTFDVAADPAKGCCFVSLGRVKNMAWVKLNGRDLGILWCDPWRAEIPGGVLRQRDNVLEITVANLWINRLIGDSGLPPGSGLTWTTYNPFRPDSPLQESGLLGPVSVQSSERDAEDLTETPRRRVF